LFLLVETDTFDHSPPSQVITTSLRYLANNLNPEYVRKQNLHPLMVVELGLWRDDLRFHPDIHPPVHGVAGGSSGSVPQIMDGWIDSLMQAGAQVRSCCVIIHA